MTPFRSRTGLLVLLFAGAAQGCSSATTVDNDIEDRSGDVATAPAVPAGAIPVAFQEIPGARTQISTHVDPSRVVIRDAPAWETFWQGIVANIAPRPAAPAIDFGRHLVFAAAMGQRPSGGYTIRIDSVFVSQGTVYAVVRATSPGPACGVAAVLTAPVAAVLIDRVDGPVRFVERRETAGCT